MKWIEKTESAIGVCGHDHSFQFLFFSWQLARTYAARAPDRKMNGSAMKRKTASTPKE